MRVPRLTSADRLSVELLMGRHCTTPHKRRFRYEVDAEAWSDARSGRTGWKDTHTYRCRCGWWHLTTVPQ